MDGKPCFVNRDALTRGIHKVVEESGADASTAEGARDIDVFSALDFFRLRIEERATLPPD